MRVSLLALIAAACVPGVPEPDLEDTDVDDTDVDDTDVDDTDTEDPIDSDTSVDEPDPVANYRNRGAATVTHQTRSVTTSSGCVLSYELWSPAGGGSGPLVVLAHGLQRAKEQQAELSSHLASWGYTVATPTLCTSAAWNIDQEKNGADLAELAEAVRPGPVVFVGHSAGGLASIVAGDVDPDAVGVVSLDGVEARGIAAGHAPGYPVPVYGLVGGPGPCNANNNFDDLYPSFNADVVRVAESDHCDFEAPTDWLCTSSWICAATDPVNFTGDDVKSTIFALATAAVAAASGDDRVADAWWASDGQYASPLYDAGAISPL